MEGDPGGSTAIGGTVSTAGEAVAVWKDGGRVYVVVVITGDGPRGEAVGYVGSASEEELARLAGLEQRQALLAAVKAERDRRRALDAVDVQGLVGAVTL